MIRCSTIAGLVLLTAVAVGRTDDPAQPAKMTPRQKQAYEKLRTNLQAFPVPENLRGDKVRVASEGLRNFLSVKGQPRAEQTGILASTLANGINDGIISVDQSLEIAKAISSVLELPTITYPDVNRFVHTIDPLVQSTNLDSPSRVRLYRDAVRVITTAPNYSYNQR
jgi:hypothetical protein